MDPSYLSASGVAASGLMSPEPPSGEIRSRHAMPAGAGGVPPERCRMTRGRGAGIGMPATSCGMAEDELDGLVRRLMVEAMDGIGIDASSFVGRERARANLAFLQMLREQHEERGREFRRGLFQNSGNLVALALMSLLFMAGGWMVGHGFTLK